MDLSPKLLTDVQFREQWRGYNPDEVDEFLERVAAGVEELQQRLAETLERASSAERRLLERSDEDEIRRTLVLAQRTAVASMEEARAEADRLVSETEATCRQLVAEAEAEAARLDADIATRRRIELGDLAEERAALQLDVEHLRSFLDGERDRLGNVLRGQLEWLERGYSLGDLPKLSDVADPPAEVSSPAAMSVPAPTEATPLAPEPDPEAVTGFEPEHEPDPLEAERDELVAEVPSPVDELRLAREELADALRRAGVDTDDTDDADDADADAPLQLEPQLPRPALYDDQRDATAAHDVLAEESGAAVSEADAEGEGEEPLWRDDVGDDDDPFLAELRRAVIDTEPLGPRDDDHHQGAPMRLDDDDDVPSGGFFRRGRRRS